jgi:uncharacterized protein YjiS (DUF1127 family)
MAAIHWQQPHYRARRHNAVHALGEAGRHLIATVREWGRRVRGRAELAALDDRMLKDIGMTRAEAEFLSNRPFWRE